MSPRSLSAADAVNDRVDSDAGCRTPDLDRRRSRLYLAQAATYAAAAHFARREDHAVLTRCYLACALLDGLFGACRALHVG